MKKRKRKCIIDELTGKNIGGVTFTIHAGLPVTARIKNGCWPTGVSMARVLMAILVRIVSEFDWSFNYEARRQSKSLAVHNK
jgi:hypothetical protein